MATNVVWEGNIGNPPEFKSFANGNNEPRRMVRLNVYFDNSFPDGKGGYTERGGFWANVELWHKDAEAYAGLYQKGMRVLVQGRAVMDRWEKDGEQVQALKVDAIRIGILPQRIEHIVLQQKPGGDQGRSPSNNVPPQYDYPDDDSFHGVPNF